MHDRWGKAAEGGAAEGEWRQWMEAATAGKRRWLGTPAGVATAARGSISKEGRYRRREEEAVVGEGNAVGGGSDVVKICSTAGRACSGGKQGRRGKG